MKSKEEKPKSRVDAKSAVDSIVVDMMSQLKDMIATETIVGDALTLPDGSTLVPISRVTLGFVAGGGEFNSSSKAPPFAGGSGAGLTVEPVGFLLLIDDTFKFVPTLDTGYGKLVEQAAMLLKKVREGLADEK